MKYDWSLFEAWYYPLETVPAKPAWDFAASLYAAFEPIFLNDIRDLKQLLEKSDAKFSQLGLNVDPVNYARWENFRPLSVKNENAYSDWLAHLLDTEIGHTFFSHLFPNISEEFGLFQDLKVKREDATLGARADLVLRNNEGIFIQLEVKTGDPDMHKTYPTALELREKYRDDARTWFDFILILPSQVPAWEEVKREQEGKPEYAEVKIEHMTWQDVSMGLRKAILSMQGDIHWRIWAYSFVGAIERKLLRHRRGEECVNPQMKDLGAELRDQRELMMEFLDERR